MSDSGLDYAYLTDSTLSRNGEANLLDLATCGGTSALGPAEHPFFFSGFVEHPTVVAQGLLLLARIARTRFYVPPGMIAAVLRAADPVVTSTPEGLRFESFSVCCGVYARLDVDRAALDASHSTSGVTNVDVNPPLRESLARLRTHEPLHLGVGSEELRVTTLDREITEERVALPKRWLKGFAETQMLAAGMTQQFEITGLQLKRFVQGLPTTSATKAVVWATPAMGAVRLGSRPSPGAVCVAGPERLRVIEPLLRFATSLRGFGITADARSMPSPSAWVLDLPGARITIGLSPEKSRGFSGEGAVLNSLTGDSVGDDAELVEALLSFEPRIDIAHLARSAGIDETRVRGALGVLASSGQVGFDLATDAYFHRPFPVRAGALTELHPRLADAQRLVSAGAVAQAVAAGESNESDPAFIVESSGLPYTARLSEDPCLDRCTCPWYAKHRGTRGPCKHVLAARIFSSQVSQ